MNIKEIREELGMTQAQLACHLKKIDPRIDASLICKFEQGLCEPTNMQKAILSDLQVRMRRDSDSDEQLITPKQKRLKKENMKPEDIALVVNAIPVGKQNAIKRNDLKRKAGFGDRQMRRAIGLARRNEELIINDQDGKGYYKSYDINDIERQYWQMTNRANALLVERKPFRRILKAAGRKV